ncbi:uncharacterized protein PRD47_008558 [Ara ararauna]
MAGDERGPRAAGPGDGGEWAVPGAAGGTAGGAAAALCTAPSLPPPASPVMAAGEGPSRERGGGGRGAGAAPRDRRRRAAPARCAVTLPLPLRTRPSRGCLTAAAWRAAGAVRTGPGGAAAAPGVCPVGRGAAGRRQPCGGGTGLHQSAGCRVRAIDKEVSSQRLPGQRPLPARASRSRTEPRQCPAGAALSVLGHVPLQAETLYEARVMPIAEEGRIDPSDGLRGTNFMWIPSAYRDACRAQQNHMGKDWSEMLVTESIQNRCYKEQTREVPDFKSG